MIEAMARPVIIITSCTRDSSSRIRIPRPITSAPCSRPGSSANHHSGCKANSRLRVTPRSFDPPPRPWSDHRLDISHNTRGRACRPVHAQGARATSRIFHNYPRRNGIQRERKTCEVARSVVTAVCGLDAATHRNLGRTVPHADAQPAR